MADQRHYKHNTKRHGHHQTRNKPFLNVYHPYLPFLLVFLAVIGFFVFYKHNQTTSVLSYSTVINQDTLLTQTNTERKNHNEAALGINFRLTEAAQDKAKDMVKRNYWAHITPDGKSPWVFITKAGYKFQKAGENLAYGFNSAADAVYGWMNSPSHRANILDSAYSEVGFGVAHSNDYVHNGPETVVVAMYGQPGKNAVAAATTNNSAINSTNSLLKEPASVSVPKIALFARGNAPWAASFIGATVGICLAILFIKHGVAIRRTVKRGEKFIVRNPKLDIIFAAVIIIGVVLTRASGFIT